jgi:hypothetical protein
MHIIDALKETKEQTLRYFELSSDEMKKNYGDGKWTIRQILNHIADAETVLYDRIRRCIAEPRQVLWGFEQDEWAKNLDYDTFPLHLNIAIYSSVREAIIYLADKFYESHGHKEFVHSRLGLRTLKQEFDKVAEHNRKHLQQIEKALTLAPQMKTF